MCAGSAQPYCLFLFVVFGKYPLLLLVLKYHFLKFFNYCFHKKIIIIIIILLMYVVHMLEIDVSVKVRIGIG
jgi:hypothetical protein